MKILHIIPRMRVGGAQRLIVDLVPRFNKACSNDVLVFVDVENELVESLRKNGVKIISLQYKSIYNPFISFQLIRYLKLYDIVHVHLFPAIYWCGFASFFCKVKMVYTEHNTENRRRGKKIFEFFDRIVYSRYKKIISISDSTEFELKKWLKISSNDQRFVTINNGIDIAQFKRAAKNNTNEDKHLVKLMMVGRFAKAKDQNTIIRAMSRLEEKYHLYLVGDGTRLEESKFLAKELNVDNRVHFLGLRNDVSDLVGSCDIGIQSSIWEGFGLTAVELMAAGKPVIASKAPGLQQVVEGAGLLFEIGDDVELSEKIKLLSENNEFYNEIADKCVARSEKYDIKHMSDAYLRIYEDLYKNL